MSMKVTDEKVANDIVHLSQTENIIKFFQYGHLQNEQMRETSKAFATLAISIIIGLPRNPERTIALRKLLEAKDAAIRSLIP